MKKIETDRIVDENFIEKEQARMKLEQRRMQDEQRLFDQKLEILKAAYAQLDADKRKLERERLRFEAEKTQEEKNHTHYESREMTVSLFFKGVTNPLALKKRYRDLIKIFHPDNLCGDKETLQMINREYESLLTELEYIRNA